MFKNPLSTETEMNEALAEIVKPLPDRKKIAVLRNRIIVKKAIQGALIGIATGLVIGLASKALETTEEPETEE